MGNFSEFDRFFEAGVISRSNKELFFSVYQRFRKADEAVVNLADVTGVSLSELPDYRDFDLLQDDVQGLLKRVGVLKLNGGLGTSMGCSGPKSTIPVLGGQSFLDCIVQQHAAQCRAYDCDVPLLFMNSFATHAETEAALGGYKHKSFLQHRFPRIDAETLGPFLAAVPEASWAPPGHGDVYFALAESGLLDRLIDDGIEVLFISNADNLGATLDLSILAKMLRDKQSFFMEVLPKTPMDIKGGTLGLLHGQYQLIERVSVAEDDLCLFEELSRFPVFNTNSLWVHLPTLKRLLDDAALNLPLIVNKKVVEKRDVIQLEMAMGAAIASFENAGLVKVDRQRFLPVKTTADLLVMRSDLIAQSESGILTYLGGESYPQVRLSSQFSDVASFSRRIPKLPSMNGVESLNLDGDIWVSDDVTWSGNVSVTVPEGEERILRGAVS